MAISLDRIIREDPIPPLHISSNPQSVIGGQWVGFPFFTEAVKTHEGAPAWWSPSRDLYLRDFAKKSEHISSSVYSIQTRFAATPMRVIAKNPNIQYHKDKRDEYLFNLQTFSEFGQGWDVAYNSFLSDVFELDNGGFLEIMAPGNEWEETPNFNGDKLTWGVRHLDSMLCSRTTDPMFPVIYHDILTGERKVMHWTRVIALSLQPSSDVRMCHVGFSAVSRCLSMAERLMSTTNYLLEKMGSRPLRALLTASGISPDQMKQALVAAEVANDNARLTRFSKLVALASLDSQIDIKIVDLASLPDGFDEEISTQIGMTLISAAFGVDLREFWTASGTGATRADAVVSHMKSRGKTIGFITQFMERQLNLKYLPKYLELTFDQNDDEADEQSTNLRVKRAQTLSTLIKAGVTTKRTARQLQVRDGDITEAQFAYDELQEGRLPDGSTVLSLFQSDDALYKEFLTLPGIANPLDIEENEKDIKKILDAISKQEQYINKIVVNTNIIVKKEKGLQCLQAFKALRTYYGGEPTPYQSPDHPIRLEEQMMMDENGNEIPMDEMMSAEDALGEQGSNQTSGSFSEPVSEVMDSSTET